MTCPDCRGIGRILEKGLLRSQDHWLPCSVCDGKGHVACARRKKRDAIAAARVTR